MVVRILRDVMVACGRDKRITQAIKRTLKALEASIAAIPTGITVQAPDGSPSVTSATTVQLREATASVNGFTVSGSTPTAVVDVAIRDASVTQSGIITTGLQGIAGEKRFRDVLFVDETSVADYYCGIRTDAGFGQFFQQSGGVDGNMSFFIDPATDTFSFTKDGATDCKLAIESSSTTRVGVYGTDPVGNKFAGGIIYEIGNSNVNGTFTTADAKTVTVVDGVITSIV